MQGVDIFDMKPLPSDRLGAYLNIFSVTRIAIKHPATGISQILSLMY